MAKGPYLTDKIREMIAEIYRADPGVKPLKAQEKLLERMKVQGLNEIFGSNYPSRSTVSVELKSLRKNNEARLPDSKSLDELWWLGCLRQSGISAEAMPIVMAVYRRALGVSREITREGQVAYRRLENSKELTIREAQWIAKLYKVIDDPDLLWDWAWLYARQEWLAEVTGEPFFFPEFDLELMENPQYARDIRRDSEREIAIWDIAEKYNTDPVKLKDLNLSIKETEKIARSGKFRKRGTE
jgi:hypothetical protein